LLPSLVGLTVYLGSLCKQQGSELRNYIINKLVEKGIYTPPAGWKPYEISKEVMEVVEKAAARSKRSKNLGRGIFKG